MPNNEISRRTVVRSALTSAVTLTGLYGLAGVNGIEWRNKQAAQRERERVSETFTPELLAQHGFMEIGAHGSPVIAPWGKDNLSGLIQATGPAHEARAQGTIMVRPELQIEELLTTGRLELGLNTVASSADYNGVIPAVRGGVQVFIPEDDVTVAVRTEGGSPLSYALRKVLNRKGYVLYINGDPEVAAIAQAQAIAALDGTPFPTGEERRSVVTPFVAILPRSV